LRESALLAAVLLGTGVAAPTRADERVPVVVTPGSERSYRIVVQRFADSAAADAADADTRAGEATGAEAAAAPDEKRVRAFREDILNALEYSSVFRRVEEAAYLGPISSGPFDGAPPPVCSDWTQIGADVLLEGEFQRDAAKFAVAFRVWDTARCRELLRRRYSQAADAAPEPVARRIADDVVEDFIGLRGVSSTEIAFVSDRGGNKEIYVMNADGSSARPATANRSLNNFPDWSPDGDSLLYTSYRHQNTPFLFVSSRGRNQPGRLLSGLGDEQSQFRGVFGPAGERIAVVMSEDDGASDIFSVRTNGRRLRRLTKSRAIEVSPTWSPDGERIAFVSDRSGAPQIFVMDSDGGNTRRLTYDGSYNTRPVWSPDGQWIAYETRVDGQFDIWLIDPEGNVNVPLVIHARSDESPSWSPNARKLVFSSTRRGRADLYAIDRDGSNLRRLTRSAGNNTSPAWGPFPR
jgi:TolB protein